MARFTFCPPPGWPEPPEGFLPEAGWRPDPSWPPAPQGWQFYRDGYGYATAPPMELWQPWPPVDWDARLGLDPDAAAEEHSATLAESVTSLAPRRRGWVLPLVLALVLALLAGGLWWAWPRLNPSLPDAHQVSDVKGLYEPPLPVGAGSYRFAAPVKDPSRSFEGSGSCIARANQAVAAAPQAVVAGTDRGWGAMTWRFADQAAARAAYQQLTAVLDGCTESSYRLGNPRHSDDEGRTWVQYTQTATDGTDHGRVVLTSDANTLTWLEGGRDDLGTTAWKALRKRLATLS